MKSLVFFCVIAATAAFGETTLITRLDGCRGGSPSLSIGVVTPEIEVWGFGVNTDYSDYELGRLWPIKAKGIDLLLAGGYLTYWPDTHDWFVQPYVVVEKAMCGCRFSTGQGIYLPCNGGPFAWYSSDTNVMSNIGKGVTAGISAHWWDDGKSAVHVGPKVSVDVTDALSVSGRYCPFGAGEPTWRLQATTSF